MGVVSSIRDWLPRPAGLFGNRERGLLEVQALGQRWVLRLSLNHLVGLCERYGLEDEDMASTLVKLGRKMDTLQGRRTAFFFALHGQHPEITEEQAGEIISEIGYRRSGDTIVQALHWAMPPAETERGKGQVAPSQSPAGATSS